VDGEPSCGDGFEAPMEDERTMAMLAQPVLMHLRDLSATLVIFV